LRPPHRGRVQDFDRKVHHKEVAMKAATLTNKCTIAVPGDARAGHRPPLHSPRRRHSVARSLRTYLTETLEIEQQLGKRIRSIEMLPFDALDLGEQRTPAGNTVKRVLLVDADPDAAAVLSALLAPEAQVVHAATLAEAQRSLTSEIFSAVVIDPQPARRRRRRAAAGAGGDPAAGVFGAPAAVARRRLPAQAMDFPTPVVDHDFGHARPCRQPRRWRLK
jgi:CheY-like chemotaxis protein